MAKVYAKVAGVLTVSVMFVATVTLFLLKNVLVSDKNLKAEKSEKDVRLILDPIHGSFLVLCILIFVNGCQTKPSSEEPEFKVKQSGSN